MSPIPRTDETQWEAVLARDTHADGAFVYAVHTTGVYCRPSCPSRRPRRSSVSFFAGPDAAEVAGFRECRRCHPRAGVPAPAGLDQVRRACAWIQRHAEEPLTLALIAGHVGTSPFHLQRTFTKLVGLSPRTYQEAVRAGRFRTGLRRGTDVSGAVYDAGYGSISRVYERRPTGRGMTPAVYRRGGKGMAVTYTIVDSPVGRLMVAGTPKGVCSVKLGDRDDRLENELRNEYPEAAIAKDDSSLNTWVSRLLKHLDGSRPHLELPLDVQATAFQWKVWRHLQSIPYGETRAYSDVARAIGKPDAVRAVARACATNPVCLVVPCHRVVGKDGSPTGYRWGLARKQRLLDAERPLGQTSNVKGQK
jgi:AraC family transcriptional regulator of adaptative response/methylated-DNA-[protein]-cysteine methyltransferase